MPLREDLLEPIAGDNPAGADLYYDKVFDQIKEARMEETDDLPAGDWGRSEVKKAAPMGLPFPGCRSGKPTARRIPSSSAVFSSCCTALPSIQFAGEAMTRTSALLRWGASS